MNTVPATMTSDSPRDGAATASAAPGFRSSVGLGGVARRTLGISMLMVTVFLWTASNFMASVCRALFLPSSGFPRLTCSS